MKYLTNDIKNVVIVKQVREQLESNLSQEYSLC